MSDKSKDELIAWLKHYLELCQKDSSRRDEKWMTGIEEVCKCKINFSPLGSSNPNPSFEQFISGLKDEIEEQRGALIEVETFLLALKGSKIISKESLEIDDYLTNDVEYLARRISRTIYGE